MRKRRLVWWPERLLALALGLATFGLAAAGSLFGFHDNSVVALIVIGALFLLMAITGGAVESIKWGDKAIVLAYLDATERGDTETAEKVVKGLRDPELAQRFSRFERSYGSNVR